MEKLESIVSFLFESYNEVRYTAIYTDQKLFFKQRDEVENTSNEETDKYEELLVNPTLLTLARQRGNIDCGGLNFIIIRYGNFYQLIKEVKNGHISICLEGSSDLNTLPEKIFASLKTNFSDLF